VGYIVCSGEKTREVGDDCKVGIRAMRGENSQNQREKRLADIAGEDYHEENQGRRKEKRWACNLFVCDEVKPVDKIYNKAPITEKIGTVGQEKGGAGRNVMVTRCKKLEERYEPLERTALRPVAPERRQGWGEGTAL